MGDGRSFYQAVRALDKLIAEHSQTTPALRSVSAVVVRVPVLTGSPGRAY